MVCYWLITVVTSIEYNLNRLVNIHLWQQIGVREDSLCTVTTDALI